MALSKTLLVLGLAFLVVSSIVSARELAETTEENSQVDLDNYHDGRGGYNRRGGYGKGHGKEHGKGKGRGGRKKPPSTSETEEGN